MESGVYVWLHWIAGVGFTGLAAGIAHRRATSVRWTRSVVVGKGEREGEEA